MAPTAIITGVGGQDGSFLTELLLDAGYRVHGFDWKPSSLERLRRRLAGRPDLENLTLYPLDVTDAIGVRELVDAVGPDEVYNLAAQSRVDVSYHQPELTFRGIVVGTFNVLEAVRVTGLGSRVFQASSSEMFGNAPPPQREETELRPVSPYALAKTLAHQSVAAYRDTYGMFVCAGVMFNHESSRRNPHFVTRRITKAVAEIYTGRRKTIELGRLDPRRDWGHARDYVGAMRRMLQQDEPADYVVATGESRSVAEFAEMAFSKVGLRAADHVVYDPTRERLADPGDLRGDITRIRGIGWQPSIILDDIVGEMLAADLWDCGVDPAGVLSPYASSMWVGDSMSPAA